MTHSEVIEERGQHRVSIVLDESASEPDHDGQGYVFHVEARGYRNVLALLHRDFGDSGDLSGELSEALERYGFDWELIERYLRVFHDVVGFDYADPHRSGGTYVCIVTREQRDSWGCPTDMDPAAGTLEAWTAWATGDTWGWVVEEATRTAVTRMSGEVLYVADSWTEVDSCWGYYGREDAEGQARAALEEFKAVTL